MFGNWNYITGLGAFLTCLPVVYMSGRLFLPSKVPTRWWLLMALLVPGAYGWRAVLWDLVPTWVGVENWRAIYAILEMNPNTFWNICVMIGNSAAMIALYYTIPRVQRIDYRWWNGWTWPRYPVLRPYLKQKWNKWRNKDG